MPSESLHNHRMTDTLAVPRLIDRVALRARYARAQSLGPVTFLNDRVGDELQERLQAVLRDFRDVADVWTPGGLFRQGAQLRFASLSRLDMFAHDDETLALEPQSLDLALSALALHFANDLPGLLLQIRRALRPDGLFLAALLGGDTLSELRQAFAAAEVERERGLSPRVLPFADLRDLGALLQRAGFALPVADVDRVVVRYGNAFALMQDLRGMGATNVLTARRRTMLRRSTLLRMAEIYNERFADDDGRIRATFDIVWLSGWAPHASQQQPLQPGSATARLEDAVKQGPGVRDQELGKSTPDS
jgi:SAM-dependent methyltransferase